MEIFITPKIPELKNNPQITKQELNLIPNQESIELLIVEIESLEKERIQVEKLIKQFDDDNLKQRLKEIPVSINSIYDDLKKIDISDEIQIMELQGLEIYRNMKEKNDYSKSSRLAIIENLLNKDLSGYQVKQPETKLFAEEKKTAYQEALI